MCNFSNHYTINSIGWKCWNIVSEFWSVYVKDRKLVLDVILNMTFIFYLLLFKENGHRVIIVYSTPNIIKKVNIKI